MLLFERRSCTLKINSSRTISTRNLLYLPNLYWQSSDAKKGQPGKDSPERTVRTEQP